MDFMLRSAFPPATQQINHQQKIVTIGSCFTEHIGTALSKLKFSVLQNPSGILFDPASLSSSLMSYIHNRPLTVSNLFQLGEIWSSWDHHGRFSGTDKDLVATQINTSQQTAHEFLKSA
ncbi:MAG: GSCFA domain-containing protein, partial [Chitinophagaceae bacterium]